MYCITIDYRIASNFRGSIIFVVQPCSSWFLFSWLLLALQVKVGKVASFVGKIFVVQYSTSLLNTTRENITRHIIIAENEFTKYTI